MERRRRGSQLLKVVSSSRQRNKQYYHELSVVDRGEKIPDFSTFGIGISISEIAKTVQCHRSTVYREVKRGSDNNQYCPKIAQALSVKMRKGARKYRIPQEQVEFIRLLLEADWSPEQISNVLTKAGARVSHEWNYRFIAQDKRQGGKLYRHLRQGIFLQICSENYPSKGSAARVDAWKGFTELMGGVFSKRTEQAFKPFYEFAMDKANGVIKTSQYDENELVRVLKGISAEGQDFISRVHEWQVESKL